MSSMHGGEGGHGGPVPGPPRATPPVPAPPTPAPPMSTPPQRADDSVRADQRPRPDDAEVLAGLADRPLAEHADVFERVHAELQSALADIDHA